MSTEAPPTATPEPGQIYRRIPGEPAYEVVELPWQHYKHKLWAAERERMRAQPGSEHLFGAPFYVRSAHGTIGFVPWPGSKVSWPWELAWELDLFQPQRADPKASWKKQLR